MAEKKSRFRKIMLSEVKIIKNSDYFKITKTPQDIIERKETFEFYRELSVFIKYKKPNNLLIKGFPGSGKTVTTNFVMNELKREFSDSVEVLNVNCHDKSGLEILRVISQKHIKGNFNTLMKDFLSNLKKDTLIVLDEVDRSNKIENLLYSLSRPTETFPEFKKNLSLVLISNDLHWEDDLKDSLRSSLQLKPLIFNPYSENEIKRIVKARIKKGFIDNGSIDNSLIDIIAKTSVKKRRGDCRVAIESVFYSAQIAESNNRREITKNDVKEALKISINQFDKILIGKLKDNQLLILYILCSQRFEGYSKIHKTYLKIIDDNDLKIESITMPRIFYIINYLDNLCLIDKKIEIEISEGMPRKKAKIKCNVNFGLVIDELIIRDLRLSDSSSIQQNTEEVLGDIEE